MTNTNDDRTYCPDDDFRAGDVVLHYVYIDGATWREFDRDEPLTPGDTLSVLADNHNPEMDSGFLTVKALDPVTLEAIDFDYLIGSAIVVQSDFNFLWGYTPYSFRGNADDDTQTDCSRIPTDADGDGFADFDGSEYDTFPKTLFIDSFFQETGNFGNLLVLLSTAGMSYQNEVNFLIWNNREQKFSRNIKFQCFLATNLKSISNVAGRLNGDPNELGRSPIQTGWVSIAGGRVLDLAGNQAVDAETSSDIVNAPLLGVFMQTITGSEFSVGNALHFTGSIDGLDLP
ncbi:MAG: hypothetical protein HYR85_02745 [Planctomycetes bacterium]|nr:hypothetical protein [Planctomycetota bacterium]MBI3844672.1 hypothetical protein [Planctomycetota bacterium]